MLRINNLHKSYGPQLLFDGVSLNFSPGERVGLVGRNGHGKTTLFRLILGEEEPDSGDIVIPRDYRIGHLSQHLHFTGATVLDEAISSLRLNEEGWLETYRAEATLSGLGFSTADFGRSPSELSGGFQIRLNLAKVLIDDPNLLLLDEPTNYLDIVSVRWLTRFLRSWEKELIIITHDRDFMDEVTTHTMAIHRSKMKKVEGSTEKLYQQILLEEEIYEQTRANEEKKRRDVERFINRFRAQATRAKAVQSRVKALEKMETKEKLAEIDSLDFKFNSADFPGKWPLEVENLTFSYDDNSPPLIEDIRFAVGKRDRIGIIGKNGKGKTTLLNLLAGELKPTSGKISRHSNAKLAYFGQTNISRLSPHKTVEQEILDIHPDRNRGVARKICGLMMFEGDSALKKVSVLSGGEKSRVLLGKLLVTPTNLLLLDEPTNHLDMDSIDSLLEAIDIFPGAVLIVTHSEMILRAMATRLIVFDADQVTVFEGTYDDFLSRTGWEEEQNQQLQPSRSAGNNYTAADKVDKKEMRRLKAEKTKALAPLKKKVEELERKIMRLEEEIAKLNANLIQASNEGKAEEITKLSTTINQNAKQVNILYQELEQAMAELEAKSSSLID